MNNLTKTVGAIALFLGGCYAAGYIVGRIKGEKRGFEDGIERSMKNVDKTMYEMSESIDELVALNSDLETLRNKVKEVNSSNQYVTKKMKERIK